MSFKIQKIFNHREIPIYLKDSTTYIFSIIHPNGKPECNFPKKDITLNSFLWITRRKRCKIRFLVIKQGSSWVLYKDVPNRPRLHLS